MRSDLGEQLDEETVTGRRDPQDVDQVASPSDGDPIRNAVAGVYDRGCGACGLRLRLRIRPARKAVYGGLVREEAEADSE